MIKLLGIIIITSAFVSLIAAIIGGPNSCTYMGYIITKIGFFILSILYVLLLWR